MPYVNIRVTREGVTPDQKAALHEKAREIRSGRMKRKGTSRWRTGQSTVMSDIRARVT